MRTTASESGSRADTPLISLQAEPTWRERNLPLRDDHTIPLGSAKTVETTEPAILTREEILAMVAAWNEEHRGEAGCEPILVVDTLQSRLITIARAAVVAVTAFLFGVSLFCGAGA